jgi:mannose-1-phosphate guanylyltransferase
MLQLTHALLLTAGLGTRLRPLTLVRAKPAIPVAGVPMARRIIRSLAAAGITDVVLNLHYLADTIASVVGDGSDLGVRARYSWEQPVVLGSAGGPRQALDIVGVETFAIVNGDTLTDAALPPLVAAHASSDALVTMAVVPNAEPQHYSGLRLSADGAVLGVEPRGSSNPSFHFIGVQIANRRAFSGVPPGRPANSVGEVYDQLIAARPGSVRAHVCDAGFWDIGTVADYWTTSRAFERLDARPPGSAPLVGSGARFIDSIAWDDVVLGDRCTVSHCIVTDGVRIAPGAAYSNSILMRGPGGQTVATSMAADKT